MDHSRRAFAEKYSRRARKPQALKSIVALPRKLSFISGRTWTIAQLKDVLGRGVTLKDLRTSETMECPPGGKIRWQISDTTPGNIWSGDLVREANSGGHSHHHPNAPIGKLVPKKAIAGKDKFIEFHAPEVSGLIAVRWSLNGKYVETDYNRVRVPNLFPLSSSQSLMLIGWKPEHPDNHYGHLLMNYSIAQLADRFYRAYSLPLQVNDMSLVWGGLFDTGEKGNWWKSPHAEHRDGLQADVRTNFMNKEQKKFVKGEAAKLGFSVLEETKPPHFHLRLRMRQSVVAAWEKRQRIFKLS